MGRRTRAAALVCGAVGLATPTAAHAVVTCSFNPSTHVVDVQVVDPGNSATIARSGSAITVNGTPCDAATVTATDKVNVTGGSFYQKVILDESSGALAPGFTAEATGASEIELEVALGSGPDELDLIGTPGNDKIRIGNQLVNLNGDDDADLTQGSIETIYADGSTGNDALSGAGSPETGGAYARALYLAGGEGNDTLKGGDGADGLHGDAGDDVVYGGYGRDSLEGSFGADQLFGGADADALFPGTGVDADLVDGGAGNDFMYVDAAAADGDDVFAGGSGTDSVGYDERTAGVTISLDGVANDGTPSVEHDNVMADVEILSGGSGPDRLTGSPVANQISGLDGADVLNGLAGDDKLYGGPGADTILGGDEDDTLAGAEGADRLYGQDGDDRIEAGDGNDGAYGGAGADTFVAGSASDGNDTFSGGLGADFADYTGRPDSVGISLNGAADDGTYPEQDNVRGDVENAGGGLGADTLVGSAAENTLGGNGGADQLLGLDGADTLSGGDGGDTLRGGNDADYMSGDAGDDYFAAFDGEQDTVLGGTGTDSILDSDPFDTIIDVP